MAKRVAVRRGIIAAVVFGSVGNAAAQDTSLTGLYDLRLRYETADADAFQDDATAATIRARIGAKLSLSDRIAILVEGEAVEAIVDDYNSLTNGRTSFPVIADPEAFELNRAQFTFTPHTDTKFILGRQTINLANQRFIGAVDFRQNQQTFDAVSLRHRPSANLDLHYAYVGRVHRILGDDHPAGDWDSESHLFHADWTNSPFGALSAYTYLLDLEDAPAQSSATVGFRLTGKKNIASTEKTAVSYEVASAIQSDYGTNTTSYTAAYWKAEGALHHWDGSVTVGLERLGSDNGIGFSTPLATLHKFQGFADVFLATPTDGILDRYISGGGNIPLPGSKNAKFRLIYHDFQTVDGRNALGTELDGVGTLNIGKNLSVELKGGRFRGSNLGPGDISRVIFSVRYRTN